MNRLRENEIMRSYLKEKSYCCGCEACVSICPSKAIVMTQNEEGFYYPEVDNEKCISCGKCEDVCPMQKSGGTVADSHALGIKNKDIDKRWKESSGGFFSVLCEYIKGKGGIIYGVQWEKGGVKVAKYGRTEADYEIFQGSKYLQSRKDSIYVQVSQDLENDKWVLFTGTPCDNAALKEYLRVKGVSTNKLLSVDVICAGVTSPKIFADYIDCLQEIYKSDIEAYNFRDKSNWGGWLRFGIKAEFANGLEYRVPSVKDFYSLLFQKNFISRLSCYDCRWASPGRETDFTLGDFWGIEKNDPDFFDEAGISLVLVNSEKAKKIFREICDKVEYRMYDKSVAAEYNSCLLTPAASPENREKLWGAYRKNGFMQVLKDNWLSWKIIDWILSEFQIYNTVVDFSVNRNWMLHEVKREREELEVIEIHVDKDNFSNELREADDPEAIFNRRVSLLRLELEGGENAFLERLTPIVMRDKPIIVAELMRKWANQYNFHPNDICRKLNMYGYECYAIAEDFSMRSIREITNIMDERWYLFVTEKIAI